MPKFSYYEFMDDLGRYVSLSPSSKTIFKTELPKFGDDVFPDLNIDLFSILKKLEKNNLGFFDYFWFLPKSCPLTEKSILETMSSLYYEPLENTPRYGIVNILSKKFKAFRKKVYIKDTSLPKDDIDVIYIMEDVNTHEYFVCLSYIEKPNEILIAKNNESGILMLPRSLYGYVLFEESVNKDYTHISQSFRDKLKKSGLNLVLEDCQVMTIEKDSRCCDVRYDEEIGYKRHLQKFMICIHLFVESTSEKMNNEPGFVILSNREAIKEFKEGGKYTPAFKSHPRHFLLCLSKKYNLKLL